MPTINWERDKDMSLEDLCDMLAPNGVMFTHIGSAQTQQRRDNAVIAANAVTAALPYLRLPQC